MLRVQILAMKDHVTKQSWHNKSNKEWLTNQSVNHSLSINFKKQKQNEKNSIKQRIKS